MLAAGTAAKVLPCQQYTGALVTGLIEHEVRVQRTNGVVLPRVPLVEVAPLVEQVRAEAGTLDRLEKLLGNDLVGIDVRPIQRGHQAGMCGKGLHAPTSSASMSRTSTKWPAIAAAAAMAGLTRWVRPPLPCRPSKLRLDVAAQCSPGRRRSGFMARHMEQPGSRHSKPAALKITSRTSRSACSFTRPDPGTTIACLMVEATLRPLATTAAARRSSIRELVHEPMKTRSSLIEVIG